MSPILEARDSYHLGAPKPSPLVRFLPSHDKDIKEKIKVRSSYKALLLACIQRLSFLTGFPLPLKTANPFSPPPFILIPLPVSVFLCLPSIPFNLSIQGLAVCSPGWSQTILLSSPCLWTLLALYWLLFWLPLAKSSYRLCFDFISYSS